jgi:hypothetical protein
MKKAILWGVVALTLLAFVGCKDDDDPEDQTPPPDVLKLTVTGIPSGTYYAPLFDDFMQPVPVPLAVGILTGNTFSFFTYVAPTTPGGYPSIDAKFTTLDEYYILIADSMDGSGTNYIYCTTTNMPGVGDITAPAKFNFTKLEGNTLAWGKFVDQSMLGQ